MKNVSSIARHEGETQGDIDRRHRTNVLVCTPRYSSKYRIRRGYISPSFNRLSICRRPDSRMCFFLFSFCLFGDISFSKLFFVPLPFSLCMKSTSYVLSIRMMFFYLVTTGWIFDFSLLCENSIISIKNHSYVIPVA